MSTLPNLLLALPEFFLVCATLVLLVVSLFQKKESRVITSSWAITVLLITLFLVLVCYTGRATTFEEMFIIDYFAVFMKVLVILSTVTTLSMSLSWLKRERLEKPEFSILMLFATLGMLIMISANDLMAVYIGLELQGLSLYVISTYHRDSSLSTEAGLKYFILGTLASGLLLFGMSFIYGFTGYTNFARIASSFTREINLGVTVGMIFIVAGLSFKISAVPFHMWTPDVYEGAPTPVTAFFSLAPKIAAMALLVRIMTGPFMPLVLQWQRVVMVLSVSSMVLGAFAAINQSNIKRLMAYSSIGHVGYALVGLAVGNVIGIRSVLIYLAIYFTMNIGVFAVILSMRQKGRSVVAIDDLSGLSMTQPITAAILAVLMFSMAGIPPLAGFFGKLYVFMAAIGAKMYVLAISGVLASVVSSFYYLRIIKIMYFDETSEPLDKPIEKPITLILIVSGISVLFFFSYPIPLLLQAETAASSLFSG